MRLDFSHAQIRTIVSTVARANISPKVCGVFWYCALRHTP